MDIKSLLDAGQDILGAVSDAVDTGDYSNLAWDIKDIVFGETDSGSGYQGRSGNGASGQWHNAGESRQGGAGGRDEAPPEQRGSGSQGGPSTSRREAQPSGAGTRGGSPPKRSHFLVKHLDRRRAGLKYYGGLAGGICCLGATALSLLFFAGAGAVGLRPSPLGMLIFALFVVGAVFCMVIARKGKEERQLIDRYYEYGRVIGTREYFSIAEVASATGQSAEQVRSDMEDLHALGAFPFLAMDRGRTTVMLTERMAQEYERAERARTEREEEERRQRKLLEEQEKAEKKARKSKKGKKDKKDKKNRDEAAPGEDSKPGEERDAAQEPRSGAADAADGGSDSEIEALIREGNASIRTIREINDRIPDDQEMSDKLYRLENIMKRIFERIRKEPARAKDIRRLMNYYLPTTIKLLNAYAELCEQPSNGENVRDTKRQIEAAMDTINDAFETLLDDLFEDQAWDIASEINVMRTMMAQDGLVDETKEKAPTGTGS